MERLRRPAIKAGMGSWTYYMTTLSYKQMAMYVKMPKEVYDSEDDSERVQRDIIESHVKSIETYLIKEDDRFFDAIVLAIKGGKPRWYPGVFEKDGQSYYSIGILELSGDEGIFPIDGQHRLNAIKNIASIIDLKEQEEIPVIMITHGEEEKDTEKMRRLFTSLNRYAKTISLADFILLDEDDISAIATRYLANSMECLKDRILYRKNEAIYREDKKHFINMISFYKCNDYLLDVPKGKSKAEYKRYRPTDKEIEVFEDKLESFWLELIEVNTDVNSFIEHGEALAPRSKEGGSLFFRPRGIDPYVEAVAYIHKKRPDNSYKSIMEKLSHFDMDLNADLWRNVLWDGEILAPGQPLMRDIFVMLFDKSLLSKKRQNVVIKKLCELKNMSESDVTSMLEDGFLK